MDNGHRFGKAIEIAVAATVAIVLTDPSILATLKPRVLLYTSNACKVIAERAGRLGIRAEAAYAETVSSIL